MPTPFPGMDPYLERRGIWEQVHTDLIVSIRRFLTPLLRPRYHVGIEERTSLAVLPPNEQGAVSGHCRYATAIHGLCTPSYLSKDKVAGIS